MLFNINGKPKIPIGTKRHIYKFCFLPLKFRDNIYWLQKVMIEEVYSKDAKSYYAHGYEIFTYDAWCIKNIYTE